MDTEVVESPAGTATDLSSDSVQTEMKLLKLQLEMMTLKAAQMSQRNSELESERTGIARHAKDLKTALAPMPTENALIPAWFKTVDALFSSLNIPEEIQGTILLPYLNEKIGAFIANQANGKIMPYKQLKEVVLGELRMTAHEYRRMFLAVTRQEGESWSQVATRLETMFSCYLRSRNVETFERLQKLLVADRLKQLMPENLRAYVTQSELKGWMPAKEIAEIAANFEESVSYSTQGASPPVGGGQQPSGNRDRSPRGPDTRANSVRCFGCGQHGHYKRNCRSGRNPDADVLRVVAGNFDNRREKVKRVSRDSNFRLPKNGPWVEVLIGDKLCTARVDSGADITVIKAGDVPTEILGQSSGKVKLTGAFGKSVTADLMYIPLGVPDASGSATQRMEVLCAVTEELDSNVGALITPDVFGDLCANALDLETELREQVRLEKEIVAEQTMQEAAEGVSRKDNASSLVSGPVGDTPLGDGRLSGTTSASAASGGSGTHADSYKPIFQRPADGLSCMPNASAAAVTSEATTPKEPLPATVEERGDVVRTRPGNVLTAGNGEPLTGEGSDTGYSEAEGFLPETERSFAAEQRSDESLAESWRQAREGTHGMIIQEGLLYHKDVVEGKTCLQLVVPKLRRAEVLGLAHDSPCAGHFSQKKTKGRIKNSFFWPGVASDVRRHCQTCHGCQVHSRKLVTDRVPITPLTRPSTPFEVVYLDCIGPLEPGSARGHKYALSVVDLCTRWAEVIPLRSLTAKATCQGLIEVFSRCGTPQLICSDQGTNFTAKLTAELMERLGVSVRFATPEHPQSNGIVERWNGTFKAMLRHVIDEHGGDWDRYVPCLLWAYREVPHDVTGVSPFELMYGRVPQGPLSILRKSWTGEWAPPSGLNKPAAGYLMELRERMSAAAEVVNERSSRLQQAYTQKYNLRARKKEFRVGDEVLVVQMDAGGKMQPKWTGPVTIKERQRNDSYVVRDEEGNERLVHANKLRPYYVRASNVGVVFETDAEFGDIETAPHIEESAKAEKTDFQVTSLDAMQARQLKEVLVQFGDVFSDRPGKCIVGEHRVTLIPGTTRARPPMYKVPMAMREEVERQITELLEWDFIYPVHSPGAHPIVCALKKDGSIRICVDYRSLNAITVADSFPMGNVTELLYSIAGARYISVLDMTRGYWQIPLEEESQSLTAFATHNGLYAWKVMPYGLRSSAATFQRVVNGLLAGHRQYACAYIDDVAVFSETWEDHISHLKSVLQTIRDAKLTVNPSKCRFAQSHVKYLGHVVGSGTHAPDPDRIAAIEQLKPPRTKRELRSILGLLNYYREYVPAYSHLVLPLTALTGKRVPNVLPWNGEAQAAFESVKEALTAVPGLTAPDPRKDFCLATDASEVAIGACLSQEESGVNRAIAFLSKKLTPAQRKWSAIEREAYAIVWSLGCLDTWLFGNKVKILTDHDPLTFLTRSAPSSARLMRWSLALQKYNLEIAHVKGSLNKAADALSRLGYDE